MKINAEKSIEVLILAIPETAGSALYGMVDMLSATGNLWQTLVRSNDEMKRFKVKIVSTLQNGQERPPVPKLILGEELELNCGVWVSI
jgi:hypothetical protein